MRANPRIGKNEAYGVLDMANCEFVGIEEQRSNGKAGSIGACALITAS
jgi:hypothetical protein